MTEYVLVTHFQSNDEIHWDIITTEVYKELDVLLNAMKKPGHPTRKESKAIVSLILDNSLQSEMFQTYVYTDMTKFHEYRVCNVIHIPELGS